MTTREEIIAAAQRYWRRDKWNNEYFDAAGYADFVLASWDSEIQRLQMALADAEALELGTAENNDQLRAELAAALAACKVKDEALNTIAVVCYPKGIWQQAREALYIQPDDSALKAWLGKPVAYRHLLEDGYEYYDAPTGEDCDGCEPLYSPKGLK